MRIFRYSTQTIYELTGHLCIVRKKGLGKIRFYFPEAGFKRGLFGLRNMRFSIRPRLRLRYFHWLIITPIFYWERSNGGFKIGLPNLYLWRIR